MKYKTVIWDFNGTILDDTGISISSINTVLSRRGMKTVEDLSEFQEIFCFPVSEYYRRLGFDFNKEPYKIPADEWVELYSKKMFDAPLYPGIRNTLSLLKQAGMRQIVLSACEQERLERQIEHLSISRYFDEILGCTDVYAKGKSEIAKEYAAHNPDIFPALFIGDTDHDLECANEMGCDCILFSGGFMSKRRLLALGADVIDDPTEIISKIL